MSTVTTAKAHILDGHQVACEMVNPHKDIPKGTFATFGHLLETLAGGGGVGRRKEGFRRVVVVLLLGGEEGIWGGGGGGRKHLEAPGDRKVGFSMPALFFWGRFACIVMHGCESMSVCEWFAVCG